MNSGKILTCFKSYDVRAKLGTEFNDNIAYRIGRATAQSLGAKKVVLGFDVRETSPILSKAVASGISDAGADILEIGCAGTEEMYSAVAEFNACAGIEVTASHNPIEYNGMKFVKRDSKPLSENEFFQIKYLAEQNKFISFSNLGKSISIKDEARKIYLEKIIGFVDSSSLKPLKIVINSGNGAAGPTINLLTKKLEGKGVKTNFVYLHHEPDSSFPNGIPNPILEENRSSTSQMVIDQEADFGVAFDGDFDRCFLFDHLGNFIPGEYVVGLLTEVFLNKENGARIIHDPRIFLNTLDIVKKYGGHAVKSKTGHAYLKAAMRESEAVYGGEMSAHHYFRDFFYCDSGMVPWLLVWEILSQRNVPLFDLISDRKSQFPSSGEINFSVANAAQSIQIVKSFYSKSANNIDEMDGLSMSFKSWRFNLRQSNTEPLVRLNVEANADEILLKTKVAELSNLIAFS